MNSYLLGFDVGSSSVKAALIRADTKEVLHTTFYPRTEMGMIAHQSGWAEQHPEAWWENLCHASRQLLSNADIDPSEVISIGISYQMHGLVLIDKEYQVLRPAIIWSDSRAVRIGEDAFNAIGKEKCLRHLLNSPGNFTASKLKWVMDNEPDCYDRIYKFLLPGDYIAMKMTGEVATTIQGLSEGMMWDFKEDKVATFLLDHYGISSDLVPELVSSFGMHGALDKEAARQMGLVEGIQVSYRSGDQPNNAMSLNAIEPGEIAATGGTSGVVYAVVDKPVFDPKSRVNGFAHVNHTIEQPRVGILLCINGAGSQYAWVKNQVASDGTTYEEMERMVAAIPVSAEGLRILPFGNGAERVLDNREIGSHIVNLQFNRHKRAHFYRAALEGIAFSFIYGIQILKDMNIPMEVIRVGDDNLFQSTVFSSTIASLTGCEIEVVHTNGAIGAARAAGYGVGYYASLKGACSGNRIVKTYSMLNGNGTYHQAYETWKSDLQRLIERQEQ